MNLLLKCFVILLLFTAEVICPQTKSNKETMETDKIDTDQVLDVTRQLTQLMIDKDTAGLNRILDMHFTLTHITGYVQPKEEWFSEIESERMKYYSYKEVKTTVKIDGDKATFVGQNLLDARIWGTRNNWRLQQTMQLEKRNGKWIILKSVAITF
ncbi:MAG TPA: nuclear transport factor 2 family protein [Flavobacterium sp.]|uniref:nuclear transport factor 2 family protein n=1 Tax=Flavobacterium sp. TaxID=239 RepID=UPI002DB7A979|nr:nuclear transport factor 2 family protein [Flavobacterium sp.]HEU4790347.1 nuclear transport factor 2 family protein [Flavobacterium sp.]